MQFKVLAVGVLGATLLAACAPKAPPPIAPEPIYDKYGNAIYTEGGQNGGCEAGYYPGANNVCVPYDRQNGGEPNQPTGRPNTP
jgi:hypothetical protein